jgi:hypothetical protein
MNSRFIRLSALLGSVVFAFTACGGAGSSVPATPGGINTQQVMSERVQGQAAVPPSFRLPLHAIEYQPPADTRIAAAMASPLAAIASVPLWSSSFKFGGTRYPFYMVGSSPYSTDTSTTVPTVIIPINFSFADGTFLGGEKPAADLAGSPIFKDAVFPTGTGQWDDTFQRANFAKVVGAHYHILLGAPSMLPAITVKVPKDEATIDTVMGHVGTFKIALVNIDFINTTLNNIFSTVSLNPKTLAILVVGNVFEYEGSECCILGFHSAFLNGNGVNTFAYGSYNRPNIFSDPIQDITVFSHETAEWLDDPLIGNVVPSWGFPQTPTTCFSNILEVGDVIEGYNPSNFPVKVGAKTYHPQDLAFYSWFAHQVPSIGIHGQYSYLSPPKLTAPPPPCT